MVRRYLPLLLLSLCMYGLVAEQPDVSFDVRDSVTLVFKIDHDEEYDAAVWNKTILDFCLLELLCSQSKQNDDAWLDFLGEPFVKIYDTVREDIGIHAELHMYTNVIERAELRFSLYHDQDFDRRAWANLILYLDRFFVSDEELWQEQMAPLFLNVIESSPDSGIHGILGLE